MYKLLCLGEAALRSPEGDLVHFRSRKHFALLVYLALNTDRAHRREFLAGLLWSESEEPKARHSLSQALYAIRRLLDGAVRVEGEDLELGLEGIQIDALDLERRLDAGDAAAAADLYKGPFLKGFWIRGAQGFEEWAARERARVGALARDALRQTISSARDRCDWPDVQQRAERLVELDPFDETAHSELMRALWMLGDRAAALEHYDKLKELLASELSTSPSTETEALAERIRQRSARGGWRGQPMLREADVELFRDPPFVGRKQELAVLAEEWQRVATGESRTVTLVGSAGIGKTRLAEEFIKSLALDDVTVLRGRCYEAEQALPYGPVAEALRQGLKTLDLSDVNPLWLAELARIVPEAHERFGKLPEPAKLDPEGGRRRLYEGIAQVLRAACEVRPLLLFIDDLHWADESSLALLHYLRRRVTNGVYLLTAHRPEELKAGKNTGLPLLESPLGASQCTVEVGVLSSSETSDLIIALLGEKNASADLDSLQQRGSGNPLFTVELARTYQERRHRGGGEDVPVPPTIRALLDRRFHSLGSDAFALMQQAAVIGARIDWDVLLIALGMPPLTLNSLLNELNQSGIMRWGGTVVSFRHDLVRELAIEHIPAQLARTLHLRAARALIRTDNDAGEIAAHLIRSGRRRQAYGFALRAATAAERVYALDEASELLKLAIQVSPDRGEQSQLTGRLGRLYLSMRDYKRARPLLRERLANIGRPNRDRNEEIALKRDLLLVDMYSSRISMESATQELKNLHQNLILERLQAPMLEAEILRALLWAAARSFQPSVVDETVAKIQLLHDGCTSPDIRCRTGRSLGIYACYIGNLAEAEARLQEARNLADQALDDRALIDCYVAMSALLHRNLRVELAERILETAVPLAEQQSDPAQLMQLLSNCAACYMYLGHMELARQLLQRAQNVAGGCQFFPDAVPSLLYNQGFIAFSEGDLEEAGASWQKALDSSEKLGVLPVRVECLAGLGMLALKRQDIAAARKLAAQALRLARRGRFLVDQRFGLEELLAHLRYQDGRRTLALRRLADVAECGRLSDLALYLSAQTTRLQLLIQSGSLEEARLIRDALEADARELQATMWLKRLALLWESVN